MSTNVNDLKKLGKALHGTRGNIFTVAKSLGISATGETFEELLKHEQLFRCPECNVWCDESERYYQGSDLCCTCGDEIDGPVEDEE